MAQSKASESADQRREKLKALRERRGPSSRKPASAGAGAGSGGGASEGGDRRAKLRQIMQQRSGGGGAVGGGGAKAKAKAMAKMKAKAGGGGAGNDKRAKLMKAMKDPQQREKLMEKYPQLRQKLGGGAKAGGKAKAKAKGGARRGGAAGGADPALGRQVKALEGRIAELERELKQVRQQQGTSKSSGAK